MATESASMKEMTIADAKALGYTFDSSLRDTLRVSCPPATFTPLPVSAAVPAAFSERTVGAMKTSGIEILDGVPDSVKALEPAPVSDPGPLPPI